MVLSLDPETIWDPSGENPTERIQKSWPRKGGRISTPVLASQTRMVLSSDPEIILDPSGENATERIQSPWPCSGGSISTPVLASQTRIVLSLDPDTILDQARMRRKQSGHHGLGAAVTVEATSSPRHKQLLAGDCDRTSYRCSCLLERMVMLL